MKRFRVFAIGLMLMACLAAFGAAPKMDYKFELPLGLQIISNPTISTALTVPVGAKHAMISIRTNAAMYRDDGTDPTSTVGFWYPSGTIVKIDNDRQLLQAMRFINSSDGATTIYVNYYGDRP